MKVKKHLALVIFVGAVIITNTLLANERSESIKTAVEYFSGCGNFIRYDNDYVYTGFGSYWTSSVKPRQPKPSVFRFVPIDRLTEYQVPTLDSVIDVVAYESKTYLLTYSGIEQWDLKQFKRNEVYRTYNLNRPFDEEEHPKAFAKYKDKLIIAHGRLGISFFDLKTKKVTASFPVAVSQRPLESVVNDVTVLGKYAYAVLDSYSLVAANDKPAFRGVVVIDMDSEAVVAELDGLDPGADSITSDSKNILISFYGQPIWKYSANAFLANKLPTPLSHIFKFPVPGHPTGKAAIDDKYYYTCYSKIEGSNYIKVPFVLDRTALRLN